MTGEDYAEMVRATSARLAVEAPVPVPVHHNFGPCPTCGVHVCLMHHRTCAPIGDLHDDL